MKELQRHIGLVIRRKGDVVLAEMRYIVRVWITPIGLIIVKNKTLAAETGRPTYTS